MNNPTRDQIQIGDIVEIVTKQDQKSGVIVSGAVKEILTSSQSHPYGIKVRLEDGRVGRVKRVSVRDETAGTQVRHDLTQDDMIAKFADIGNMPIPRTEDQYNEFKEFYQYNKVMDSPGSGIPDKALKRSGQRIIATAICAFGNSQNGGFLYIGVDSDGVIRGLEKDMNLEGFGNYDDAFANHIRDRVGEFIGDKVFMTSKIRIKFQDVEGSTVCIIHVLPSDVPLWLSHENNKVFFVRGVVPRAEKLAPDEQVRYIRDRFPRL